MLPAFIKDGAAVLWRRGRICHIIHGTRWEADWQPGVLQVAYREADLPKAYRRQTPYWRKGDPSTIAIKGMLDWAEYDASQWEEYSLVAEDYVLEIKPQIRGE